MAGKIKVVELFAGVGGFRLGLEGWEGKSASTGYKKRYTSSFQVVWSNQWEPSTKRQDASEIYEKRFGSNGHSNKNISEVTIDEIPNHDLLVGGFPCQDYSVARTLNHAKGLEGKKGVLWWEIHRILSQKKSPPKYLFLENVDRLLKSPSKQRGRDFAIMLATLSDLGYIVEWRVVNAADYGMPQRRRRVFFLGYHKSSPIYKKVTKLKSAQDWIMEDGLFAKAFPVVIGKKGGMQQFNINGDVVEVSSQFNNKGASISPFRNSGIMINRTVHTIETAPSFDGPSALLGDILISEVEVPENYIIDKGAIEQWKKLKGAKKEKRVNKSTGFEYQYNEGSMVFPDPLDKPSRTIITGEGGASPSRFKHVIKAGKGKLRRLTPIELERLNMFPDNHTEGATDIKRAFFMGNALVVGIIEKVGQELMKHT